MVVVAWRPSHTIGVDEGDGVVDGAVARPHALVHSQGEEVGLDGRTYLASTSGDHVVLEMREVRSTHISLDRTRMRIHGHESATEEMLVPTNGIERGHGGVDESVVGEDTHIDRRVEDLLDVAVVQALFLEGTIAVGLTHRTIHDSLDVLRRKVL